MVLIVVGSWPGKVEVWTASSWVKMWRYSSRACCQAFYAKIYPYREDSEEAAGKEMSMWCASFNPLLHRASFSFNVWIVLKCVTVYIWIFSQLFDCLCTTFVYHDMFWWIMFEPLTGAIIWYQFHFCTSMCSHLYCICLEGFFF